MITQLIKPISTIITTLPYVSRYGGIVNTASRSVEIGTTEEGHPIYHKETFPVACGVSAVECWEDGRYADLIPNDNFNSIFYFEQIDGMRYEGVVQNKAKTFHKFSERLRLVGWLNLSRFGIIDCTGADAISIGLIKALNAEWKDLDDPMKIYRLESEVINIEPKHYNPFEKYAYNEMSEMWMYPYDYVSMIIEVRAQIAEECMEDFEPGDSVDCPPIDFSSGTPWEPPSVGGCERVEECLGISEEGDPALFLNEQGEFVAGGGGAGVADYSLSEQVWERDTWLGETIYWRTWIFTNVTGSQSLTGFTPNYIGHIVEHSNMRFKLNASSIWQTTASDINPPIGPNDPYTTGNLGNGVDIEFTVWYTKAP